LKCSCFVVPTSDPSVGFGLSGLTTRVTNRKGGLPITQWRKDSKKTDVIPVGSSDSTPSVMEDVVIVGESRNSTSSSTSRTTTTSEIVDSMKEKLENELK
jgi:hypothetical protein